MGNGQEKETKGKKKIKDNKVPKIRGRNLARLR